MRAEIRDGWVAVPYDGPELGSIHIAVAQSPAEDNWQPAYLDYVDGRRVAKIRTPAPTGRPVGVWLRVGNTVTSSGKVTI
ncbi:hypothetical protein [Microtetraspora malaysiensis]|uniref:hypothetical protein n=1 Tax=Microtetraspora malaysiensis TaxID=161358 RepID=UPI003D8EF3C5